MYRSVHHSDAVRLNDQIDVRAYPKTQIGEGTRRYLDRDTFTNVSEHESLRAQIVYLPDDRLHDISSANFLRRNMPVKL